jgi:hypothetical protein
MAPTATAAASSPAEPALEIDLKDPRLAAFLAWLIPGLGHFYQGRTAKGVLFSVCILGTFFYGLYIGNGQVVYASTPSILTRWQYLFQLGVGLPAAPALIQRQRALDGKAPLSLLGDVMRPPRMQGDFDSVDQAKHVVKHPDEVAKWNHDSADMFEMGTVYTIVAGLLNLLVICDAFGGPLVIHPPEDKKKPDEIKRDVA